MLEKPLPRILHRMHHGPAKVLTRRSNIQIGLLPLQGTGKLKSHKFNHNCRDTVDPMCLINDGIEDTEHFLLQCHAYSEQRRDLLGAINKVLELHNISNLPNHTVVW